MKVSYNWLKDYVDTQLDPEKLASMLTMAGVSATSCKKLGGDYIFEFEITANRTDCLSVLGIARETAAILGKKFKIPKEIKDTLKTSSPKPEASLDIALKDPDLCYRYTGRIINNVDVGPSPDWLKEKLVSVGLRPVNNIVDITNFVLFETGQPMHAFDLDKIKGSISIRKAKNGEKIITIDNKSRTTEEGMLVIADDNGPIAIAGVMGGMETEANNMTKNILLESAFFNSVSIRRTSRALGISSESSYRFERRIDNSMVLKASNRASVLVKSLAGGEINALIDAGNKSAYSKVISYNLKKANSILGTSIKKNETTKIFKRLGFAVSDGKESLKVVVPSFREDVKSDVDLIEEVARIYGYKNIPLTIPQIVGNTKIKDNIDIFQDKLSLILTRLGLNEVITYSLIKKDKIKKLGISEDEIIAIKNPLSIDQEIMRPTLLPGMLGVISYNFNRKAKSISAFEIGKAYRQKLNAYREVPVVSVGLSGIKEEGWKVQKQEFDFFNLKGIFERVFQELKLKVVFKRGKKSGLDKDVTSIMECDNETIGYLGEVDKETCKAFDIEKKTLYGELFIDKLLKKTKTEKGYSPIGKFPSVARDISILLDRDISSGQVTDIIRELGESLVKQISLIDRYTGKQIPEGKHGLLYRIEYRSEQKTLTDSEVDNLHSEIKKVLSEKLNITFR